MYVVGYRQYDAKHVRSVYSNISSKAIPMNKKSWNPKSLSLEQYVQPILERLPVVSFYAKTRGWPFIIAWIHRITGVVLALYFCVHIYTLSFLADPAVYETKMKLFGYFILSFLEWLLAVPVIFHALNGGRLILFEVFGSRNDESSIRWVLSLSITYVLMLGLMMIRQDQSASLIIFWLPIFVFSISLVYLVALKIRRSDNRIAWKLHRMTGVYLLLMIPAHLLFMHLEPALAHEAITVINRMQHVSVKFMDLTLVLGVSYHAGYGLISICKDYLPPGSLQNSLTFLIALTLAVLGWIGMKLTIIV
jgi:succinate dehydrogenase cytochrome b556 subunit